LWPLERFNSDDIIIFLRQQDHEDSVGVNDGCRRRCCGDSGLVLVVATLNLVDSAANNFDNYLPTDIERYAFYLS
jgi:hypothetical protein